MTDARKTLENLLDEVATTLAEQVSVTDENGSRICPAASLAVAVKLLKDNGITAVAKKGSPLGNLVEKLPQFSSEDDEDASYTN